MPEGLYAAYGGWVESFTIKIHGLLCHVNDVSCVSSRSVVLRYISLEGVEVDTLVFIVR